MPAHVPNPPDPSDPLAYERAHLAAARAALKAMRAEVESLDTSDVAASRVSAEVLRADIANRVKALADLAHAPLFFGRLDYAAEHATATPATPTAPTTQNAPATPDDTENSDEDERRFYIGRRHVHDAAGDPMVVDWRAPISQPFYRASRRDPLHVELRRRFGYTHGELTAYEDEHLTDPAESATSSNLLQREIERPRVGPMRDIVATIQP